MDEETISLELFSDLEKKLHDLFVTPRNPKAEEEWRKHYIGEIERELREYSNQNESQDFYHGIHYRRIETYTDEKIKIVEEYHKGKRKVRVYH